MYEVYIDVIHMKRKDWDVVSYLYNSFLVLDYLFLYNLIYCSCLSILFSLEPDNLFSRLIVYFLCRLKISHDSHKFILEFGTVVNNSNPKMVLWFTAPSM